MKRLTIYVCIIFVVGIVSCNVTKVDESRVRVVIPDHPWEDGEIRLWYTLKWNNNGKIESLYVDKTTREVEIVIPRNCTVYVCAYPLGEMLPFGTALTPANGKREVILSQNEGYVAHLLINSDLDAAEHVNFAKLIEQLEEKTYDFRTIDDTTLVADVINGCLGKDSIETVNRIAVPEISIPNGKWMCEWESDGAFVSTENSTGELEVPPGVFRYYCKELDREFRIVVEANGTVFHSLRYGMIGL